MISIASGNAIFLWSRGDAPAAFFFVTTVSAAGALLGPIAAIGFGIACTAAIGGAVVDPAVALPPATAVAAGVLVWFGVILVWASTHPVYTALAWAWTSYLDALKRTEELRDRQGELNRALASLNETCSRLEVVNQELARARAAAEEARQLKTEFAANISHELRTPLNLIIGFSEILMASPGGHNPGLTPEARADVDVIHRNARHLSNLIADDLPMVYVDRTRIRQVLINLLANAARFTSTGGASVTGESIDGSIVVHVVDTGVGIAPEDIPKAFEEFRQLNGSTRRQHDGSGLGLAICRRFVELHGGSIWAESEPGRGTTFSFTLPLINNVASSTPFIWMLSTSLKTTEQTYHIPPIWIPNPMRFVNFPEALRAQPFDKFFENTAYYAVVSCIGAVFSASVVAYGFARIRWVGRNALFAICIATLMIPFQVKMVPLYLIFRNLHWLNSYNPLVAVLPYSSVCDTLGSERPRPPTRDSPGAKDSSRSVYW